MDSDRGQIENLLARYCELYDAGDFAGYAELFAHGRVAGPLSTLHGADEVRAYHEENCLLYDGSPQNSKVESTHVISTTLKLSNSAPDISSPFLAISLERYIHPESGAL